MEVRATEPVNPASWAYLIDPQTEGERIYFARDVWTLVQGIWQQDPTMARKIVRNRIYTSESMRPDVQGLVKVAAKRITGDGKRVPFRHDDPRIIDVTENARKARAFGREHYWRADTGVLNDPREWARTLAARVRIDESAPRYERDRAVAAVLVAPDGEVLAGAINSNALNRTLHAEVNLLQSHEAPISAGSRIYVTLQCCRMCAALILSRQPEVEVLYGEPDPGPLASGTALALAGLEKRW